MKKSSLAPRFPTLLMVAIFCSLTVQIFAAPASPRLVDAEQADGSKIKVKIKGDEFYNWKTTEDGYPIKKNKTTGFYEYLKVNKQGKFESTKQRVGKVNPKLIGCQKNEKEAKAVIKAAKKTSPLYTSAPADPDGDGPLLAPAGPVKAISASGTKKMIAILAKFANTTETYSRNDFNGLYNTLNYNDYGANGSVRDYYLECSDGAFTLDTTVTVWVTLPNNEAYYTADNDAQKWAEMVRDAVQAADAAYDFTHFDDFNNTTGAPGADGILDIPVDVIHYGYGQEESGNTSHIWSHKWDLSSADCGTYTADGVLVDAYHTEPEKKFLNNNITTIGVICHETGHAFGLPDLYDTDGSSEGIGNWGLMAGGGWNGPASSAGSRPAQFCGWSKAELGWLTPVLIDQNKNGQLIDTFATDHEVFKINRGMAANEYLLIENRQKGILGTTFDDYLPGEGLLIYHIDDNIDPGDNTDNNDENQYRVGILQADGDWDLNWGFNRGDDGDPYPGSSDNRTVDSTTDPDTDSYYPVAGTATPIQIFAISDSGSTMSFNVIVSNASFTLSKTDSTFKEDTTDTPDLVLPAVGVLGTDTFTVVLDVQPTNDVVFNVTSSDTGEVTVAPATLTFTNANWNTPRTVTMTSVEDIYAGDDTATVTVSVDDALSDSDYASNDVGDQTVSVTLTSDEVAGITLSTAILNVAEPGGTGNFTVVLDAKPRTNVQVSVKSSDTGEGTVSPSTLYFTTTNWNVAQPVTVTGVDDSAVGDDTATITMSVVDGSSDNAYDPVADATVAVTFIDDEDDPPFNYTPDFTETPLQPGPLSVGENGGTDTFTVVLNGEPHTNVVLNVVSADTAEATVNKSKLTFTPANWNVAQTVTVIGVNDNLVGPQSVNINITVDASSDSFFVALNDSATLVANCVDDDVAGFSVSKTTMNVGENGGTNTFTVVLTRGPVGAATVEIDLTSGDVAEATVSPASVTFNTVNWNIPQTITVTGVDDDTLGNDTVTITATVDEINTANTWDLGVAATPAPAEDKFVVCTMINDDIAGFIVNSSPVTVPEGGANTFTVELTAEPDTNVVLNLASNDLAEATIDLNTLTFTPANWDTPQTVTVTGVEDLYATEDTATILVSVDDTNSDNNFDPVANQDVDVNLTNNDPAGFTVTETGGTTIVAEAGGTDTFTVVIDAKPHSNVVINVTSLDEDEATVDKATLTFTPTNYAAAQTVTVTGVDDDFSGDDTVNIRLRISDGASDNTFDPLADQTVAVTCTDDENAEGFVLNPVDGSVMNPDENTKTPFSIVLTGRPHNTVIFDLTSSDTGEVKLSTSQVTFTQNNWDLPKSVSLTLVNDNAATTDTATITVSVRGTSDAAWVAAALPNQTLTITPVNDDAGAFSLTKTAMNVGENGGTNTFDVVLLNQPTGNVQLDITEDSGATEATVAPAALTFTNANWNVPQTVTVTGVNDLLNSGDAAVTVTVAVNGASDAEYLAAANQTVAVTVKDDDPTAVNDTVTVISGANTIIRVLNNDTDPDGDTLTIVSDTGGASTAINASSTAITYTAGAAGVDTFNYTITDSNGGTNHTATVNITIVDGYKVSYGSIVEVDAVDVTGLGANFLFKPKFYGVYTDPFKLKQYTYKTAVMTKAYPAATVQSVWKKYITLYNKKAFSTAYKNGVKLKNFTGQETTLACQMGVITKDAGGNTITDNTLAGGTGDLAIVVPPSITDVVSFDASKTALGTLANPLHKGSEILIRGKYFGSKAPKVWFEYTDSRGRIKMARCKLLYHIKYDDERGRANRSYMELDPTLGTYGDSEIKVLLPTKWPRDWVHGANDLVIDNRIGMATISLVTIKTSDQNDIPGDVNLSSSLDAGELAAMNDTATVNPNTKNNEIDILDNDFEPNGDNLTVTIVSPPDNGGKVKFHKKYQKMLYTPAKGFAGAVEIFTYRITEKYTDQKLSTTATVTVTVNP